MVCVVHITDLVTLLGVATICVECSDVVVLARSLQYTFAMRIDKNGLFTRLLFRWSITMFNGVYLLQPSYRNSLL